MGLYFSSIADGKNPTTLWPVSRKGTFQPTTCTMALVTLMSIFASEDWYGQAAWLLLILQTIFILILLAFNFLTSTFFFVIITLLHNAGINDKQKKLPLPKCCPFITSWQLSRATTWQNVHLDVNSYTLDQLSFHVRIRVVCWRHISPYKNWRNQLSDQVSP